MPTPSDKEDWKIPFRTDAITPELVEAIGAVAISLTLAEEMLVYLFHHISELEEEACHAIAKDLKPVALQRMTIDLATTKDFRYLPALKEALSTLSGLREKRNQYLHWTWRKTQQGLQIKKIGLSDNRPTKGVSLADVRQTVHDLNSVFIILLSLTLEPDEMERLADELRTAAKAASEQRLLENEGD